MTIAVNGLLLVTNLTTGIITARAVGPAGRGQLAATLALVLTVGWIVGMGCGQAVAYHQARHPEDSARLIATWLTLLLPLGLIGFGLVQLGLPVLFSAQTATTRQVAAIYAVTLPLVPLMELVNAVLTGDHDFSLFNALRLAQPVLIAAAYVVLWWLGGFTVVTALIANAGAALVTLTIGMLRITSRHGLGRPSRRLGRTTLWYAVRGHGGNASTLVSTRLDLLIIPAFLGATSVGWYSVATNVSWLISSATGALSLLVLPAAARQGRAGTRIVIRSLHATLALSGVLAVFLAVFAGIGIQIVYGAAFEPASTALRLLLPGTVLFVASSVLTAGLYASNRPFAATLTQLVGAVATVVGLLLFLQRGGIVAAAIVSTVSYALVFAGALIAYRRANGLSWSAFVPRRRRPEPLADARQEGE